MGWSRFGSLLIISGAFGLFQRSVVAAAGGYSTTTVGEDVELVVRLHRYLRERGEEYRIEFIPDPVAWTEVPEDLQSLGGQRRRWQRGLVETLWRHQRMTLNPRFGMFGLVALPSFFLLEVLGPLVELLGYPAVIAGTATRILVPRPFSSPSPLSPCSSEPCCRSPRSRSKSSTIAATSVAGKRPGS